MAEWDKHIERMELEHIVDTLQLNQYINGLLLVKFDYTDHLTILNRPFRSNHYTLMYVTKGTVSIRVNMFEYVLSPGKILAVSEYAIKEFIDIREDSEFIAMSFTESFVMNSGINQAFREAFNIHLTQSHHFVDTNDTTFLEIVQLVQTLEHMLTKDEQYATSTLLFFSILNLLAEELSRNEAQKRTKNRKSELVMKFFRLLPDHIYTHRDVNFYARELNINPRYLSTTLKEKTGKTALTLIAEMVVQEAKVLLSSPELTISDVAHKLGFPDPFTFSKYFKLQTGVSPSEYRNS